MKQIIIIDEHTDPACSLKTTDFFNTHPAFSLNEAARILAPAGGRSGAVERLKYHLKAGRLKLVTRGVSPRPAD